MRLAKKSQMNVTEWTKAEIESELSTAYKEYKKIKAKHVEHREAYMEQLAEVYEAQKKGSKANIIRQLIEREQLRDMYRKLRMINKKINNLSTSFVPQTTNSGDTIDITDREEMEQAITNENKKKYHQTELTCPFIQNPLKEHFGNIGKGPRTEAVLNGSYQTP